MRTLTIRDRVLDTAADLGAREVTGLAETYRSWRSVLAAALDAVHLQGSRMDPTLAEELRERLSHHVGQVPESDLEDAVMALWLSAATEQLATNDSVSSLLREPWRVFNATRTADRLRVA